MTNAKPKRISFNGAFGHPSGLYNPGWGKWGTPHEDFGPEAQNQRKNEEF